MKKKSANYALTWIKSNAEQLKIISKMVENRELKPIVDLVYTLKNGTDAYKYLSIRRAQGKVIISPT